MAHKKEHERSSFTSWIILFLFCIFLYNTYIFINTEGSSHPLVGTLFNMIIFLLIFFFTYHKKELKKEQYDNIRNSYQTYLDNYFKIFKKHK